MLPNWGNILLLLDSRKEDIRRIEKAQLGQGDHSPAYTQPLTKSIKTRVFSAGMLIKWLPLLKVANDR